MIYLDKDELVMGGRIDLLKQEIASLMDKVVFEAVAALDKDTTYDQMMAELVYEAMEVARPARENGTGYYASIEAKAEQKTFNDRLSNEQLIPKQEAQEYLDRIIANMKKRKSND
jgi:hypothetical protein